MEEGFVLEETPDHEDLDDPDDDEEDDVDEGPRADLLQVLLGHVHVLRVGRDQPGLKKKIIVLF